MAGCPACGTEVGAGLVECPNCHLATSLFDAVHEAAGRSGESDPAYVRTIAELMRSVDLETPAEPTVPPLLRPSAGTRGLATLELPKSEPALQPEPLRPLAGIPALPPTARGEALRRRADDYLRLGRRRSLELAPLAARVAAAEVADDGRSLDAAVRELFVHLASALAVEFEAELARRNEIAQLVPTPSADVELNAIRGAIGSGDLLGADRRLAHVRDELGRLEDIWATGRILIASCDLLSETITELGGDPGPALGPMREGRKLLTEGRRETAERLLARSALALWAVAEPRFFEELKRLRDRLLELRGTGVDLAPALADLRAVSVELRRRNFVGTVVAYRGLRTFLGPAESSEAVAPVPTEAAPERPAPPT
jgi:hypothetical protein